MSETALFFIFRQSVETISVSEVNLEGPIMITWWWRCIHYWLLTVFISLSRLLSAFAFSLCPLLLPLHYIFFPVLVCLAAAALYHPALSYISMRNALDWRKNKKKNKSGLSVTHSNIREHLKNFLICLIIFEVTVMHSNPDLC